MESSGSGGEENVSTLIEGALELEELDMDLYRSKQLWVPPGGRAVFGGQVMGQALMAAVRTVDEPFVVHSLHATFLLPGDHRVPILYHVDRVRNGSSFCTRHVTAKQRGNAIFSCSASFQKPEPFDLEHQFKMPPAPDPDAIPSVEETLQTWLTNEKLPKGLHDYIQTRLATPIPIEIKDPKRVDLKSALRPSKSEPRQAIWMRAKGHLNDRLTLHQCVAAYASDHIFLTTALLVHGMNWFHPKLRYMATLDHSMWFHAPFRQQSNVTVDWLLFEMESPRTGGNRGLVLGRLYTRDGRLVASCAQEGLIRTNPESKL